ncbi:heme peroxidase 2 [Condylostylus longicornis]|uniref:heme peroxidase 2 n=1 Tax=Condylostylus longicornis TaxID=2530218 RepID=UPI00244E4F52|nr:heme peroxidase 2 [Condylostylus longicornis]
MFESLVKCKTMEKNIDILSSIKNIHEGNVKENFFLNTEEENSRICKTNMYRTLSGHCNNIFYPKWGSNEDNFLRLIKSEPEFQNFDVKPPEVIERFLSERIENKTADPFITSLAPGWAILVAFDIAGDLSRNINEATSYLDASNIYGYDTQHNEQSTDLKSPDGKITESFCRMCDIQGIVGKLHKIFVKEHNTLADELHRLNPTWSSEKIFREARKIVIAEIQHITFNEYIPFIMGAHINPFDDLRTLEEYKYSSSNRPGTFLEFALITFLYFGTRLNNNTSSDNINVILNQSASTRIFNHEIFEKNKIPNLSQLIEIERNNNVSSYSSYLKLCRISDQDKNNKIFSYEDLKDIGTISPNNLELLKKLYKNASHIDLVVGALMETPLPGSLLGPTASCISAIQYSSLRISDRYWYEDDIFPSSLTKDQLKSIRKFTLSSLLCNNGKDKMYISRKNLFLKEDDYLNFPLSCKQFELLDIEPWDSERKEISKISTIHIEVPQPKRNSQLDNVPTDLIQKAVKRMEEKLLERKKFEYNSWLENGGLDPKSPEGVAAAFNKANTDALRMANVSLMYEYATNEILQSLNERRRRRKRQTKQQGKNFDQNQFSDLLQVIDISSFISPSTNYIQENDGYCNDFQAQCNPNSPFRTLSGRCNNEKNPEWGQFLSPFLRLLPPQYDDGVSKPRSLSTSGLPLPNPRTISTLIHPDISNLHGRYSLMVMQYAQFLDHDLTLTPTHRGFHESIPSCRKCDSPKKVHPECNPFPIPAGDHYYPEFNITSGEQLCFPFMRSLPGQQGLGPRDQINQNTHILDGSQIYGQNNCIATKLKGFSGRLNSTIHPVRGKELLPQSPHHPECKSAQCFIGGDDRASEQPGLTTIHTIFLREHNRIVEGLRGVNPHWNSEQLYENARKIVIAQNQHITYNEFLPRILSWNAVNLYGLKLLDHGYFDEYDPTCAPIIFNEFAAAAFRIGHSLLRPHIPRLNANHQPVEPPLLLRDGFFKMDVLLVPGIIDEIGRGLVATPMESLDQFITGEVTNHLFEDRKIPFSGVDLISLNIQRGRDHGIPSYNNYRQLCNLKRAKTWQDLSREIPTEVIARFKTIYESVDDIDLFPGAMTERPLQGGLVGPTLACIIGLQFRQLRKCDRYWYENNIPGIKFSETQLAEIRKTTLAKIVCENLEIQGDMQRAAFDLPSNFLNPRVPCQSMHQIDLSAWRESQDGCEIGGRKINVGDSALPSPCTSCVCTLQGPQCASLRITDCNELQREWSLEDILKDEVCNSQCGAFIKRNVLSTGLKNQNLNTSNRFKNTR